MNKIKKLSVALTDRAIEEEKVKVNKNHKGFFIRFGGAGIVDLVFGYSFKYKKFVYDKHYGDYSFLEYLKFALTKDGFISVLKYY